MVVDKVKDRKDVQDAMKEFLKTKKIDVQDPAPAKVVYTVNFRKAKGNKHKKCA